MKLVNNLIFKGTLSLETGLHIGGTEDTIKIGGIDSPVVKAYKYYGEKLIEVPIVPGSSIKGKMRALLDVKHGHINDDGSVKNCEENCLICDLFGRSASVKAKNRPELNASRLIVRDAFPSEKTLGFWEKNDVLGGTEVKGENTINRVTSSAMPRFFERVASGSVFNVEFVLSVYEGDDEKGLVDLLKEGIALLSENYLGGSGSRGYGKVKFSIDFDNPVRKSREDYLNSVGKSFENDSSEE